MPDDLKCSQCDSRELVLIGEEELYFVYRCLHCQTISRVRRPAAREPATANLDQAIRDLSSKILEWKSETQRDEEFHRMEEERRHLENRLDAHEIHLLDLKRLEPVASVLAEIEEIRVLQIQLFDKIHKNLTETLQLTPERKTQVQILARAIENTLTEINVQDQRSPQPPQSKRLALLQRLNRLNALKLNIEVYLIRRNFPILDKQPAESARLITWEKYLKDLADGQRRVKNEYSPSDARQVLLEEFRHKISGAEVERKRIRKRQLEHMLTTRLEADLPDNLGDLGRELDVIDNDLRTLHETKDPLAGEIISRLENRHSRVVSAIKLIRFRQESKSLWEKFKDWLKQLFGLIES